MKKWMALLVVLAVLGYALAASASRAVGVTPHLLARGSYDAFKVRSSQSDLVDFKAEAKDPVDIVVRQHDYVPGGFTGWHTHPGPVFITVKTGTVTFYEYDDPTCTPHAVSAGQGYVDSGRGHYAINEGSADAQDMTVIIAPWTPPGQNPLPFRGELDPPDSPACAFLPS